MIEVVLSTLLLSNRNIGGDSSCEFEEYSLPSGTSFPLLHIILCLCTDVDLSPLNHLMALFCYFQLFELILKDRQENSSFLKFIDLSSYLCLQFLNQDLKTVSLFFQSAFWKNNSIPALVIVNMCFCPIELWVFFLGSRGLSSSGWTLSWAAGTLSALNSLILSVLLLGKYEESKGWHVT